MLTVVVNIFNFFGTCASALFFWSFSAGKIFYTFTYQTVNLLISLITSVISSISVLFDEFMYFYSEIDSNVNKAVLSVSESAAETVENFKRGTDFAKETTTAFFSVRKDRISDLSSGVLVGAKCLFNILHGGLSLLLDLLWFLVTFLPNTILLLFTVLSSALLYFHNVISSIFRGIMWLLIESYATFVQRLKTKSLRLFIEVLILLLVLANLVKILKVLQLFVRWVYHSTVLLSRQIFRVYSRRRESMRRQLQQATTIQLQQPGRISSPARVPCREPTIRQFDTNSNKDDRETETSLCVVCQERPRCVVLFPCKHLCLCEECSYSLASYQKICPLCRMYINNQLQIYV